MKLRVDILVASSALLVAFGHGSAMAQSAAEIATSVDATGLRAAIARADAAASDCTDAACRAAQSAMRDAARARIEVITASPVGDIEDVEELSARARFAHDLAEHCRAEAGGRAAGSVDPVAAPHSLTAEAVADEREAARASTCDAVRERANALDARELEQRRAQDQRLDQLVGWGRHEVRLAAVAQLFSFTATRTSSRPRSYEASVLAPSFSLLVLWRPCTARREVASGAACPGRTVRDQTIQLWSIGLNVILGLDSTGGDSHFGIGFAMMFLDDLFGFTAGIDLYRRLTVDGLSADTGLLGAAFSSQGEVTPENLWLGVLLNVEGGLSALGRL